MDYRSRLAEITMLDLERLDGIRTRLRAVHAAVAATSIQAKPAIAELLDEADDLAVMILRKGAKRAIALGLAGAYGRKNLSPEFGARLMELLPTHAAGDGAAGAEASQNADQGAGDLAASPAPSTETDGQTPESGAR